MTGPAELEVAGRTVLAAIVRRSSPEPNPAPSTWLVVDADVDDQPYAVLTVTIDGRVVEVDRLTGAAAAMTYALHVAGWLRGVEATIVDAHERRRQQTPNRAQRRQAERDARRR